jgi:hypothetical protein
MPQESLRAVLPAAERRPAVWPWVLMPLAALALFVVLRSVRHATDGSAAHSPAPAVSDGSSDASGQ